MNCSHGGGCFILAIGDLCPVCRQIVTAVPQRQVTRGEVGGSVGHALEPAPREFVGSAPTLAATSPHGLDCGIPSANAHHGADPAPSLLDMMDATPRARIADPDTAHQAALAASTADHRAVYVAILASVHEHGPLTDYHLSLQVARRTGSPILRTSVGKRRGELRDMGLMCNSGHRAKTDTNTTAIRWALTPAGERAVLTERAA